MALTLHHDVSIADARAHLLAIETTVRSDDPLTEPLTLFMPVWTPGSYLVREYARHVESLKGAGARKVRKNAWEVEAPGERSLTVRYRLYCNELTVRTNHIDETHALLNGAATFLAVDGHEGIRTTIRVHLPEGWRAITQLSKAATPGLEGPLVAQFEAPDLDTLVDCPLALGRYEEESFDVLGKEHAFAIWPEGSVSAADRARLVRDTREIMQGLARLFGGVVPYEKYLFLLHLSPRGRGGLEHASCSTLLASPASFATRAGYLDLLSLIAHEALHAWNVKRIRPQGLSPYRYQDENYTRLLWWFEGATSYYDWLTLRATKLCTIEEYLEHLAGEIGHLDVMPGRLVHSLEEASFDAWIKLYRPDENSANSSISYYRKGEIVCALLDLELRARTGGRVGLGAVLLHLWERFGARGEAVPESGMQDIFERVSGVPLADLFDAWIRSPGDLDYERTLGFAGLRLEHKDPPEGTPARPSLGWKTRTDGGRTVVASVTRGRAAQRGGVDPGDEIVAVAGKRVEGSNVEACLVGSKPGDTVEVTIARDGRLATRSVVLDEPLEGKAKLVQVFNATPAQRAMLASWLGE